MFQDYGIRIQRFPFFFLVVLIAWVYWRQTVYNPSVIICGNAVSEEKWEEGNLGGTAERY